VGSANSQDIQLCGMAIQSEHCVIDIGEDDDGVVLSPHRNARYALLLLLLLASSSLLSLLLILPPLP